MEKIRLINGNGRAYKVDLPKLSILSRYVNEVALKHIEDSTGLKFVKEAWTYDAQPTSSKQITTLLLTCDFKMQYNDNATIHNTILLKFCQNEGFRLDAICPTCAKENGIYWKTRSGRMPSYKQRLAV